MSLNNLESYGEQIKDINNKITNLENKLDKILSLLENDIKPISKKMNNHINFVEKLFKFPFSFMYNNNRLENN